MVLKSYLTDRTFQVQYQEEYTALRTIHSGVPQGSTLGPTLYSLYTADLPITEHTMTVTYANDTAILASLQNHITAPINLQRHIHQLEKWLKRWRIKANEINQHTSPSPWTVKPAPRLHWMDNISHSEKLPNTLVFTLTADWHGKPYIHQNKTAWPAIP